MIKHILSCQCMWKRFPLFWNALKLQANHQPKMYRVQIICHQIMRQRHTQHVISTNEKKDGADSRLDFSFDIIHLLIFDKKAHLILLNEILLIWMAYNFTWYLDIISIRPYNNIWKESQSYLGLFTPILFLRVKSPLKKIIQDRNLFQSCLYLYERRCNLFNVQYNFMDLFVMWHQRYKLYKLY